MRLCKVMAEMTDGWQESVIDLDRVEAVKKPSTDKYSKKDEFWIKIGNQYIQLRGDYTNFLQAWWNRIDQILDLIPESK